MLVGVDFGSIDMCLMWYLIFTAMLTLHVHQVHALSALYFLSNIVVYFFLLLSDQLRQRIWQALRP